MRARASERGSQRICVLDPLNIEYLAKLMARLSVHQNSGTMGVRSASKLLRTGRLTDLPRVCLALPKQPGPRVLRRPCRFFLLRTIPYL